MNIELNLNVTVLYFLISEYRIELNVTVLFLNNFLIGEYRIE